LALRSNAFVFGSGIVLGLKQTKLEDVLSRSTGGVYGGSMRSYFFSSLPF
jgi:hypothetical protein